MATNNYRYVGNLLGLGTPMTVPGKFAAGASQAIKMGEILELTGTGNTLWVPLDSDFDMSAALGSGGKVAIAACEIKSGDTAGFYPVYPIRPGDVWEFDLLATDAQNPSVGTPVYYSSSEKVTTTEGTNIIGKVSGFEHYPQLQGHASDDASFDRGTTIKNVAGGKVRITFEESNTYYSALQSA